MYTVNSQTLTDDGKADLVPLKEWVFVLNNGNTGAVTISDVLLDIEEAAHERALSEFLKTGYGLKEMTFNTYRTDFKKNDTISVQGLPYLVKSITTVVTSTTLITTVRAIRYD